MLRLEYAIWEHSFKKISAYSEPRIFSVRSLSSRPPNHSSEPPGNCTNESDLFSSYLTSGKHSFMTFGNVSITLDCFTWQYRKRSVTPREPGAFSRRIILARMMRKVLPDRLPPASIMCVAGDAS